MTNEKGRMRIEEMKEQAKKMMMWKQKKAMEGKQ
jgi:hypothetical protein